MLIISRKTEEKFIIGGNIEITILEVSGNKVRFGIIAPKEIEIQKRYSPEPAAKNDPELAAAATASKSA
jgi:carbon storage regulator